MDYLLRCQLSVQWVIQMKGNKGPLPEKSRWLAGHLFVGVEEATGNPKMEDWMASQWAASSWDHGEETKVQLSLFSNWCSHFFLHSLFSFWFTDKLKETLFCERIHPSMLQHSCLSFRWWYHQISCNPHSSQYYIKDLTNMFTVSEPILSVVSIQQKIVKDENPVFNRPQPS